MAETSVPVLSVCVRDVVQGNVLPEPGVIRLAFSFTVGLQVSASLGKGSGACHQSFSYSNQ